MYLENDFIFYLSSTHYFYAYTGSK